MLDNPSAIESIDPNHVLESIIFFPDQCKQAWTEASKLSFPPEYATVENIVICGMGGSRFTPRTIKELFADRLTIPIEIIDDYHLPKYVGKNTLVVLSSYSGTTEEVLSCFDEAIARKACITAVTKGGTLADNLTKQKKVFYQFAEKFNPSGQPRVGSGYMLFGHLGLLSALNFIQIDQSEIDTAIEYSQELSKKFLPTVVTTENQAKQIALLLKDRHTFLIASSHLRGFVNGFANQINETAKLISDFRYIPELNHHLMEGLSHPSSLKQSALFLFLESKLYDSLIQKRYAITKEVVEKQGIKTASINLEGQTKLTQVLEAFTLSGFTTMYLAVLYQSDPAKIPWVDYFKTKLAQAQ